MSREYTDHLLELVEDGLLDKDQVILACVKYMSEDDVKDMMIANEFVFADDDDEDEGQPSWEQEKATFDNAYAAHEKRMMIQ